MAISGGLGLIPGSFGLLAVVPEIGLIIRNQVAMLYDIGMAYGKDNVITVELLLGIFGSALGAGGISLLTNACEQNPRPPSLASRHSAGYQIARLASHPTLD
ncbi:hypothetical protein [Chloroflexus sp.]|uniref:hypothetical protein n=1 Tax=Chloroflexus sp. TaxID=1904827 RepID=UPI003C70AD6E